MDQLRAIRYFAKVVELGSFSKAADVFDVPPSSLSRRVVDLEKALGAQLLTRTTRIVKVTEVGLAYYQRVNELLQQLDQSDEMVRSYQSSPQGQLKISSMAGFGEKVLLPLLNEFNDVYPDIVLDISLSDEVFSLQRDDVDIAIRGGYVPDERVVAKKLLDNEFILVGAPELLKKYSYPNSPADLKNYPAFHFKTPKGPIPWLWEDGDNWYDVTGRAMGLSNHGDWVIEQVLLGRGLSMIPRWVITEHLENGRLVELKFSKPIVVSQGPPLGVYLLYQRHRYVVPKVKAAVDYILDNV